MTRGHTSSLDAAVETELRDPVPKILLGELLGALRGTLRDALRGALNILDKVDPVDPNMFLGAFGAESAGIVVGRFIAFAVFVTPVRTVLLTVVNPLCTFAFNLSIPELNEFAMRTRLLFIGADAPAGF